MKSLRKLLCISYLEHKTSKYVRDEVQSLAGPQEPLLATIMQSTMESGRRRGSQRRSWLDNVKKWTTMTLPDLLIQINDRPPWRRIAASSAIISLDDN
ncbi:hypothetical protein ElyMa_003433600 [Elysia marginata]|uniref:Uncharacterized protein n=1 Tax=Elysia marginata TaxID=1093978 RepID=A0AAV4JW25_9GAST|nr:hypothetical protein ElyMa_003433600 [Elysia marginata]